MDNNMTFGSYFKQKRMVLKKTLRQFCLENKLDPGNISKLERGILNPPQHNKLEEYAKILEISKDSDEWFEFFDLAAAYTGVLPEDLKQDKNLLKKLPVFFRTMRGDKISDEMFEEIIEKVKETHS